MAVSFVPAVNYTRINLGHSIDEKEVGGGGGGGEGKGFYFGFARVTTA